MSDQAVQNIVSSVKTAVSLFFDIIKSALERRSKEVKGMKEQLEAMKKDSKADKDEITELKKKIKAGEETCLDFEKIVEDTKKFKNEIDKNNDLQTELAQNYKVDFARNVNDLIDKGQLTNADFVNYGQKDGLTGDNLKKRQETDLKIDECRQKALFSAAERTAEKSLGLNIPLAAMSKGQTKDDFQKNLEEAITKSRQLGDLAKKEDLEKIKNDIHQEH